MSELSPSQYKGLLHVTILLDIIVILLSHPLRGLRRVLAAETQFLRLSARHN